MNKSKKHYKTNVNKLINKILKQLLQCKSVCKLDFIFFQRLAVGFQLSSLLMIRRISVILMSPSKREVITQDASRIMKPGIQPGI